MITDGDTAYVPIIEKLQMTHQKCVFSQNNEPTNTRMENNKQNRTTTKKQKDKLEKNSRKNTTT